MPMNVGDRLSHYEVTALIGQGRMGEVYKATVVLATFVLGLLAVGWLAQQHPP